MEAFPSTLPQNNSHYFDNYAHSFAKNDFMLISVQQSVRTFWLF